MKLREYMELLEPGTELTCWDSVIDSEFYFYTKYEGEKPDEDFPHVEACMDTLVDMLDVLKIRDGGVEVNLYDLLDHPVVIRYAKDYLYEPRQYEDDSDIVEMLFDDNISNITNGFEEFSRDMVECLKKAYWTAGKKYSIDQIKVLEKELGGTESLRAEVAGMGIRPERFIYDESWLVRKRVAEVGFGLDVLVNDPHWAVRKEVARQEYALELLVNDPDERVAEAARNVVKKQEFEDEVRARFPVSEVDRIVAEATGQADVGGGKSSAKDAGKEDVCL